jgi:hypothetical protein
MADVAVGGEAPAPCADAARLRSQVAAALARARRSHDA